MNGQQNPAFQNEVEIDNATEKPIDPLDTNVNILGVPEDESLPEKKSVLDKFTDKLKEHREAINTAIFVVIHVVVASFFGYATYYFINEQKQNFAEQTEGRCKGQCGYQWCDGYGMLIILLALIYAGLLYFRVYKPRFGKATGKAISNFLSAVGRAVLSNKFIPITIVIVVLVGVAVYIYFETKGEERRLVALSGPVIFILCGYLFSKDRSAIQWRPVITGICLQFALGIICIRWEVGRNIFHCMGNKVATFLSYSEDGSKFVFGDQMVKEKIFAFGILPVIFFFSFCISILYYLGAMQWVVMKLGWILQKCLGTTVCESVNAAANIFLGMSETPLLIRPYLKYLTHSEIHAIMVSGFASVSGTVLGAYMSFGAKPAHLITSSVMAAPASLAFSKLYYPEVEESKTKSDNIQMEKTQDNSVLDAASNGAQAAISIILGIIANLVAFVAFVAFLNGVVNWLGYLVGEDELTFEFIFSKLFIPLSYVMGVEWEDCDKVAKIIAAKTIINEFVAYQRLGTYMTGPEKLNPRSIAIATFAICGFANPSSLGILIGTLGGMAPERKRQITTVAIRSVIVGSIVCFTSASFAGLLMPADLVDDYGGASRSTNLTNPVDLRFLSLIS